MTVDADLADRCQLLRSLHRPGTAAAAAERLGRGHGPGGHGRRLPGRRHQRWVAATHGYEDHEAAPASEMLAAAARIGRGVKVPATVDTEAGYGMEPAELVAALRAAGAAGRNLEDTDHTAGRCATRQSQRGTASPEGAQP